MISTEQWHIPNAKQSGRRARKNYRSLNHHHVVPERPKRGLKLYIKLEKHTLDQIAAETLECFLRNVYHSRGKAMTSQEKKRTRTRGYP